MECLLDKAGMLLKGSHVDDVSDEAYLLTKTGAGLKKRLFALAAF